MLILQNIDEFLHNPMGKNNNAIVGRELIKKDLISRYKHILGDKTKKITVNAYKDKTSYFFHMVIPTESKERRNTYDVCLKFILDEEGLVANDKDIRRYNVLFFSNCPSFVFTYAYAFNFYGAFLTDLSNKYPSKVFSNMPVERNYALVLNYEKSIFFALHYLTENTKYLNKSSLDLLTKPLSHAILNGIRKSDVILQEIKKEQARIQMEKKDKNKEKGKKNGEKRSKHEIEKIKAKAVKRSPEVDRHIKKITSKEKITAKKSSRRKK